MIYGVELSRQAAKELKRLDRNIQKRLQARIEDLALAPEDPRLSNQLETVKGRRYARVGDWRIIYEVREGEQMVFIADILPRGRAYRNL